MVHVGNGFLQQHHKTNQSYNDFFNKMNVISLFKIPEKKKKNVIGSLPNLKLSEKKNTKKADKT